MRLRSVLFALSCSFLLAACPRAPVAGPAVEVKVSTTRVGAPEGAVGVTCFDACLKRTAMRAVSTEVNEQDCRAQCEKECVPTCVQRSAMKAVSAGQIDSDCRKSCGL